MRSKMAKKRGVNTSAGSGLGATESCRCGRKRASAGGKAQIANKIAPTSKTPAASIKISATSKPAIIRIFSMSASLQIVWHDQSNEVQITPKP
jgi:hypothetical protein